MLTSSLDRMTSPLMNTVGWSLVNRLRTNAIFSGLCVNGILICIFLRTSSWMVSATSPLSEEGKSWKKTLIWGWDETRCCLSV